MNIGHFTSVSIATDTLGSNGGQGGNRKSSYLEEFKDIYETPQEKGLLVNVLGHSAPTKPCADLPHGPKAKHPLDELNCSRPFRGPTVY
jgi:hypothetical protein